MKNNIHFVFTNINRCCRRLLCILKETYFAHRHYKIGLNLQRMSEEISLETLKVIVMYQITMFPEVVIISVSYTYFFYGLLSDIFGCSGI